MDRSGGAQPRHSRCRESKSSLTPPWTAAETIIRRREDLISRLQLFLRSARPDSRTPGRRCGAVSRHPGRALDDRVVRSHETRPFSLASVGQRSANARNAKGRDPRRNVARDIRAEIRGDSPGQVQENLGRADPVQCAFDNLPNLDQGQNFKIFRRRLAQRRLPHRHEHVHASAQNLRPSRRMGRRRRDFIPKRFPPRGIDAPMRNAGQNPRGLPAVRRE